MKIAGFLSLDNLLNFKRTCVRNNKITDSSAFWLKKIKEEIISDFSIDDKSKCKTVFILLKDCYSNGNFMLL
jgi:hypothetical protein